MSRRVFFRDDEAQGFSTYGLLLDTLFRQLKAVGVAGYFPYEYQEDMRCGYAELVSFFGEEFGRLAEQEGDTSNLSILSKHVSLRGLLLEKYRKGNERYLAARNSLSIKSLKKAEEVNEPSWDKLYASAEAEDARREEGIRDSGEGKPDSAVVNSFLAAIKGAHAVDDSVAPEYVEEDDEEPVSGYSSEEDWGEDDDPSVLPADEDEEEGEEEDGEDDEGYDVLPADGDEEEDPSVLPEDEDEGYSSELPEDEDDEEYSSELPADDDEEDSSVLPEDDDEDDEEYSSELPADDDSDEDAGYSSELPEDDDEDDYSTLPEDEDDEEYSSELPADDDDEEYSSELPADEDAEEDDGYSSELPEDDDEDYSSELPEDEDEDYSSELPADDDEDYYSELPEDDDDGDSGVLPDDDSEPAPFKPAPQPKAYTSPMMSYSAPVSSMVVRPSYARGIPGRETQEAVLDMMDRLANNIKGWFSRL